MPSGIRLDICIVKYFSRSLGEIGSLNLFIGITNVIQKLDVRMPPHFFNLRQNY